MIMCQIIYAPNHHSIKPNNKELRSAWDRNPAGGGIMWKTDDGSVFFVKGLMTFDTFLQTYKHYESDMVEACFHFRIPSHGAPNAANTHPWVGGAWCVMHNGIIGALGDRHDTSDTKRFADAIADVSHEQMLVPDFQRLLNIGNSRIVLMMSNHPTIILNEEQGEWRKPNLWFSNEYDNCHNRQKFFGPGVIEPTFRNTVFSLGHEHGL